MVEDIGIADNIFGPDVLTLKGTKTRQRPRVVLNDIYCNNKRTD